MTEVTFDSVRQTVARNTITDETIVKDRHIATYELLFPRVVEVNFILRGFVGDEGIYGVLTEGFAPGEDLIERPGEVVFIGVVHTTNLGGIPVVRVR